MIEQVYPFLTEANEGAEHVHHVHARAEAAGILELHPVRDETTDANDAAIYLFRGELSEADCKAARGKMTLLGANKYSPARLRIEGNTQFTLWSPKGTVVFGFVKVTGLDLC